MAQLRLAAGLLAVAFFIFTVSVTATDVGEDQKVFLVPAASNPGKGAPGRAQVNAELMDMLREWDLEDAAGALAEHGFKTKKKLTMMEEEDINILDLSRGDWRALNHLIKSLPVAFGEKTNPERQVLQAAAAGRPNDKRADIGRAVSTHTMLANKDTVPEPADMTTSSTTLPRTPATQTRSSETSSNSARNTSSAPMVGLVDWGNCTWGDYVFDCSTLGETNPVGQFYDMDPWTACGTWSPPCDDLYMYQDPVPSIAQACAATCAEYQYVPQMSSKNLLTLVERLMRRVV